MRLPSLKILLFIFSFIGSWVFGQYIIPKKPDVLYPVYDEVGLLTEQERSLINQKLIKFEDSTSTEIEIIIIPSTNGEDPNYLATMFGERWGIGKEDKDNGVVFLIATEDRRFAIQQGRNVEQHLTASVAGQILDYLVTPHFKQEEWYQGIDKGTSAIMESVQGKFKADPKPEQSNESGLTFFDILMIAFFIYILFNFLFGGRNKGGGRGGGYYDDDVILSRRGRRSFPGGIFGGGFGGGGFGRGGGFGGGGFGGFGGGGSFGGGGASGGW